MINSEHADIPNTQAWFRDDLNEHDGVNYVYTFIEDGKNNALLKYYVATAIKFFSRFGFNFVNIDSLEGRDPYTERQMTFNSHADACHAFQAIQPGDIARIECNVGSKFGLNAIIHEMFHALGEEHQHQHPDARNFFTIEKKAYYIDPVSNNYFTGDFNPDSVMMYLSSVLGASLRPKAEILSMLEAKGHNLTTAEAIYNSVLMSEKTMGRGYIIPKTDFQSLSAIARFINPNIQEKEVELPLLAVTDLLDGAHDIAADPHCVFDRLKAYKYSIVETKSKTLTLDHALLSTESDDSEDPYILCWKIDLKKLMRLPNDLSSQVSCKLHDITCSERDEENELFGLNFSIDDHCILELHRTPLFGNFNANITIEFSQTELHYQALKTIEWQHLQGSGRFLVNQSCVAIPTQFANITPAITTAPDPKEAVIDSYKVKRFYNYYLSNAEIPFYVGLVNGSLIGVIQIIREKVNLDSKPKLKFLVYIAPYLCNLIAQIVSSTSYIRRENLMKMLLSIQDEGFIYDSPQLGSMLEKIDAENLEELLIPQAIASISVLLSTLRFMSLSATNIRFSLPVPVMLSMALAILAVGGDPIRLPGGLIGSGCYAMGNFIGVGLVLTGKRYVLGLMALEDALNDNTSSISVTAAAIKQAWKKTNFEKFQKAFRHQFFNSITNSKKSSPIHTQVNSFVGKFQMAVRHQFFDSTATSKQASLEKGASLRRRPRVLKL